MKRRGLMLACLLPLCSARAGATAPALDPTDWEAFKTRFVSVDGRVIDSGNGGISHSEGQGYGMVLAVAYGDRASFDRLWRWTHDNLALREDGLLAWKWDPRAAQGPVTDRNNASDGDLLVAWALARASARWGEKTYLEAARRLAVALRTQVVREIGGRRVILPGQQGFVHEETCTLNLSYWVFPALRDLAALDPEPPWQALIESGRRLLLEARFGPAALPPDWLDLGLGLKPSLQFPRAFGYNAVRIPLYLIWAGLEDDAVLAPFRKLWSAQGDRLQAEVALGEPMKATHPASAGLTAVVRLTLWPGRGETLAFPTIDQATDYYAASLLLLTKLAYAERTAG